ncbi:MAG: AAA family ATPase [Candidatus Nealsonbacteria bacterium]|nr:AAA family ATPase [Candidatus Nealsonbacteria bacterium]
MELTSIRIRHFRSIEDQTIDFDRLSLLVGPNSSGKSNIFRAIEFPFRETIDKGLIYDNLCTWHRDKQGAPRLSIYIDLTFIGQGTDEFRQRLAAPIAGPDGRLEVCFRAVRSGTVSYHCNGQLLNPEGVLALKEVVQPIFVPPIRDLSHGGLEPFLALLAGALRRARGSTIAVAQDQVRNILSTRAGQVLRPAQEELARHLPGCHLVPDVSRVDLDDAYHGVRISVETPSGTPLDVSNLGTGHQNILIMALFRAFAQGLSGSIIFLIDEPASHLHPAALAARPRIAGISIALSPIG